MSYRKLKGIQYPIPGVDTAIQTLRPGAKWELENTTFVTWQDDEGRQPPTWKEINEEIKKETEIYNYYLYERKREKAYPSIQDQLDMLYHDIKSENLSNGTWIEAIEDIKNKYRKPDGPEPKL